MEFKSVAGFEEHYEISQCGILFRKERSSITGNKRVYGRKQVSTYKSENGYWVANLFSVEKRRSVKHSIHRLVLSTWFGLPEKDGLDVNHIDGNKDNNHISNLEWCSRAENLQHAHANGLRNTVSKLTPETVKEIRESDEPTQQLADRLGVGYNAVWNVRKGNTWAYVK